MIKPYIQEEEEYIISLRRYFHQNPEPSMEEYNTALLGAATVLKAKAAELFGEVYLFFHKVKNLVRVQEFLSERVCWRV